MISDYIYIFILKYTPTTTPTEIINQTTTSTPTTNPNPKSHPQPKLNPNTITKINQLQHQPQPLIIHAKRVDNKIIDNNN
jgi:hypothetical protein